MSRAALGLFVGLPVAGAVLGLLMGQLAIGGRNGLYAVPATALVGLLLAWMLWVSRPRADAGQGAPPAVQEEIVRPSAKERRSGSSVRVSKSGRPDNQGGKGR
jgi:predicted lipid-binding transport protein (Tim44 family)